MLAYQIVRMGKGFSEETMDFTPPTYNYRGFM
jgi:hypothetical protein